MIPNPSNSLLGNNGQPTLEQIQQRLAQQVQDNQNPNTGQQLIDLLQQSNAAMGMVPGAGAEADQTLQQLNPTGTQSMQNLQNMRQEIEQERATDEYPFYDEKELQVNFERQKRAEDRQWQTFISSYKQEMKDKINQEHKDHVTFMTATGGTPLNLGEFAQQTGYLGGNKLQEAWEAHKENAGNVPPSNLYGDYNQTLLDSMKHRDNFNMERYTDLHDNVRHIQKRISEHHAKGVDDLSQEDRKVVQNLMNSLNGNARDIDNLSGDSRNSRNKEAEVHIRNIFPNGFNPSLFDNAILASDPDDYFKENFKLNAHDVQNITAEHHLAEVHPDTFNRIKESNLPLGLKNSIINSNSLIPLYEQIADDIIEAHEAVDYTDTPYGIGNRIHEQLKDKYRSLTLKDEIRQPTISFEKLLYNKFSQSSHQNVRHLKDTMTAFNRHHDDDDNFTGSLFEYGLGNGFDFDIFHHLELVNQEKRNKKLQDVFKSPLDYVIDNLIAKANLPTMREKGIKFDDIQSLRWLPQTRKDTFSKPISVTRSKKLGAGQVLPYEINTVAPMPEGITLPGLLDKTKRHINPLMDVSGTWVSPSNQGTLANPDFTFDPHVQAILLGNINSPNFYRREKEGAKMPGGEGFQYGGFPKDSYFRVQLPQNATPMSIAQVMREKLARENLPPVLQNPNLKLDNETLEFVNQFPEQQGMRSWYQDVGKPLDLQGLIDSNQINRLSESQKILNSPFLPVQTGEPMDIAMRLLKYDRATEMYELAQEAMALGLADNWEDAMKIAEEEAESPSEFNPQFQQKNTGEPMDIAMRLLKNDDGLDELSDDDFYLQYLFGNAPSEMNERQRMVANAALDLPESYLAEEGWDSNSMSDLFHPDPNVHESIPDHEYELAASKIKHFKDEINSFMSNPDLPKDDFMDDLEHPKHPWNLAQAKAEKEMSARNVVTTGEPMDLAMDVLLKDRISPEAKQHKLEYDKKYESSPERVKYREELNRERRNRGIYGKHNHMDVSHTEGGKLTLESEHGNRARHFKEKGTLRHEE